MRSGFATLVGRPNVGKSTLLNTILGTKVTIVSDKPQTTRSQVRGVLNRRSPAGPDELEAQVVFVDTPGIHRPRTAAGERFNAAATDALQDVDVICLLIDATAPLGKGDRFVAERVQSARRAGESDPASAAATTAAPVAAFLVLNKVDAATPAQIATQLARAAELDLDEYFPVSARTGDGVPELVDAVVRHLPEGPCYYPDDTVTDVPDAFWVAELVREQLLGMMRDELPHSIACRVVDWDWPLIRCEIIVERESQKGMVIGRGGSVLKEVGTAVRADLAPGSHLELRVKVEPEWQRRADALRRLGF